MKLFLLLKKSNKLLFIAGFYLYFCLAFIHTSFAQSLDPNNPGARPDPATLQSLGINQVRVVLKNDQATINYVNELKSAGIRVVGIINWEYCPGGSCGAYTPGGTLSQNYINNFVNNVVPDAYSTFGDLYVYQVWNEPDDKNPALQNTAKIIPPESYAQLLALTTQYLNSQNQPTITAGFVSNDISYIQGMLQTPWGISADGIAVHPYVVDPSQPGSIDRVINTILTYSQLSGGLPVWITEFGWGTSDQQKQAEWLAQVYGLQGQVDPLKTVMWYGWSDLQINGLGLLDSNLQPKLALLVLSEILKGNGLPADIIAILEKNYVKCFADNGDLMGYAINATMCNLYVPCLDVDGKVIGYAISEPLCKQQQQYATFLCLAPQQIETRPYDRETIGFGSDERGPWLVEATLRDYTDDPDKRADDIAEEIIAEKLTVTPVNFEFTNFTSWVEQRWGTLDPSKSNYVEVKASNILDPSKEAHSVPLQVAMINPGMNIPASFNVTMQPSMFEDENYVSYTKRVMTSQSNVDLGTKNYYYNTLFIGCMQATACDPKIEEDCLRLDGSDLCSESDSPNDCMGIGRIIKFNGRTEQGINFNEPDRIHALSRGMWNATAAITRFPNQPIIGLPGVRTDTQFADAKVDSYAMRYGVKSQEKDLSPIDLSEIYASSKIPADNEKQKVVSNATAVAKVYAQGSPEEPPYGSEPVSYCSNMRILIEKKEAENIFAVKAWSTLPPECQDMSDFGARVAYYLDGNYIGGCSFTQIAGAGIPIYNPGGTEIQRNGASVSDWKDGNSNCAVPITPSAAKESILSATVEITNSRGDDVPGCGKTAYCECPPDSPSCRKIETGTPPILNCKDCTSWAPAQFCDRVADPDLIKSDQCAEGFCDTDDRVSFMMGDSDKYQEENVIRLTSNDNPLFRILSSIWASISGRTSFYNFVCEIDKSNGSESCTFGGVYPNCIDGAITPGSPSFEMNCGFNRKEYALYGYMQEGITGNLDLVRTEQDIQVYDAISHIPGVTDSYFAVQNAKHPAGLALSIGSYDAYKDGERNQVVCKDIDGADKDTCLDLTIKQDETRFFQIQYPNHYQQMSAHCLSQALLSEGNKFPESQVEFCSPILSQLRSPITANKYLDSRFASLPKYGENLADAEIPVTVDRENPIVATEEQNKVVNTSNDVDISKLKTSEPFTFDTKTLSHVEKNALKSSQDRFSNDVEILLSKYIQKYGIERIQEIKSDADIPTDMYQEIMELSQKYQLL